MIMNTSAPFLNARACLLACCLALLPSIASAYTLTTDTVWQGEVLMTDDIIIPSGRTLTIRPGTTITVAVSDSTKVEPEYLSPLTEVTVRGTLVVEGTNEAPVAFLSGGEKKTGAWAGIFIDGGTATLTACRVRDAETGVYVIDGKVVMRDAVLTGNRYGLIAQGTRAAAKLQGGTISGNDYGTIAYRGAVIEARETVVKGNRRKDVHSGALKEQPVEAPPAAKADGAAAKRYGDHVVRGDVVWQGRIEIDGTIRVPEGSRLFIMPGTLIEIMRRDTAGTGIGEHGFLIQGLLIAKGTADRPIIIRSAEKEKRMGDWDAINIMNSDGPQNLIEYCLIEDAYRALHFHFSHVAVNHAVLRNNYRGMQFQESSVEVRGTTFAGNRSAIRARDSNVTFLNNVIVNNYHGADFLRDSLLARGNRVLGNLMEGVRIREGAPVVEQNILDGNRSGLMVTDVYYGEYSRNVITNNGENGLSMNRADNSAVTSNFISGNGLNGVNLQQVRATVKGNVISFNGERGIGIVSFDGTVSENNFSGNGSYAIGLEGGMNASAPLNWWGGDDIGQAVYDKQDDPARGSVLTEPPSTRPFPYAWPVATVPTDATWSGEVHVLSTVMVLPDATLTVAPGTTVSFAEGSGLHVRGKLLSRGQANKRITFTALRKKEPAGWDEVLLEHANGTVISHSVFEYATWGVHSHFANLVLTDSRFRKNEGGVKFMSGPVEIRRCVFEENTIGIRNRRGNGMITENIITRNETGIFIKEKGGSVTISRNNLAGNTNYNMRVGDSNDEDVDARQNWWGAGDPGGLIFDGRMEPGIGKVYYEPYLREPLRTEAGGVK
jgi:hypothetical protein